MLPLARQLVDAGYQVLTFDFSGTASSESAHGDDATLADDVVLAVQYARSHGAKSVGLVGASMGGYASLGAATTLQPPADAVVSLSAPQDYTDGRTPPLRDVTTPLLLYVGRDDISFLSASRFFARTAPNSQLHVLPTSAHGVDLVDAQLLRQILDFLNAELLP